MKRFYAVLMSCVLLTGCAGSPAARDIPAEQTDSPSPADISVTAESKTLPEYTKTETERTEAERTEAERTEAERTEAERTEAVITEETTEALSAEDTTETSGSEEYELWIYESEAVDNAISALMDSDGFSDLTTAEKAEKMLELLNKIAESGTEEYPYPLIKKESIYYDGDDMISYMETSGILGGVKLEPFDPMFN